MAIHPIPGAPDSPLSGTSAQPIDVQAWTEEATAAMSSVTISATSAGAAQDTTVSIQIPLDEHPAPRVVRPKAVDGQEDAREGSSYRRKEPLRRDSLKRREALLKGKEGSRRRQRWENDRLLNNPYAQPPAPRDWEIHPTHPVHHVPYYLAPLWDQGLKRQSMDRKTKASNTTPKSRIDATGTVPKELREKLKRARGAKGLLMDLESEVRKFVQQWEAQEASREKAAQQEGIPLDPDSEDDEIVFVGRNGNMSDLQSPRTSDEIGRELMLFESPAEDPTAGFGRWLVHHLGSYYGLRTWSVTTGNPARREAYVGFSDRKVKVGERTKACNPLPRPLWGLV